MSDYSKSALTQFENTGYSKIFTILNFIPWNTFSFASFIDVFKPGKAREQLKSEQACEGGSRESTNAVKWQQRSLPPAPTGQHHFWVRIRLFPAPVSTFSLFDVLANLPADFVMWCIYGERHRHHGFSSIGSSPPMRHHVVLIYWLLVDQNRVCYL